MNKNIFEFKFPKMGETGSGGTIVRWLKQEGDFIRIDEAVLEVSTDKITAELPSPVSGILLTILAKEGDEILPEAVLALLDTEGKKSISPVLDGALETGIQCPSKSDLKTSSEDLELPHSEGVPHFSPAVLNLASREGISIEVLRTIPGTGSEGRLTRQDLDRYLSSKKMKISGCCVTPKESDPTNLSAGENRIPMSPLRKAIATSIARSSDEVPHASLVVDVDVTDLMSLIEVERPRFLEAHGIKLTITSFIVQCLSQSLGQFPLLNGSLDGSTIVVKRSVNVGVAVNLNKEGVVVPVIRNCQDRGLVSIAKSLADLSARARLAKLDPWEVQEGTVTVTNFGMTGALIGMPIIRYPEVAILGIGTVQKRVVVRNDDSLAVRKMMYVTLTFDHRVLDGIYGSEFLTSFKNRLESVTLG